MTDDDELREHVRLVVWELLLEPPILWLARKILPHII